MGRKVWVPAVSGPLAGYAAGYGSWLRAQCYSRSAISDRLWQFGQLSRWLDREGLAVGEVNAAECERFATSQRAGGRVTLVAPQSMTLPEEYLRALGVMPEPVPPLAHGPVEELRGASSGHLLIERALPAPLRSEPSPAPIHHPTSFSPSSRASDYVELLIRQTHTPQGKSLTDRPVFHIIVQGTYDRTCRFPRIGSSKPQRLPGRAEALPATP